MRKLLLISTLAFLLNGPAVLAQTSTEKALVLDGQINPDGSAVTLSWFTAQPPRTGSATVKRRLYGQVGGEHWQTIGPALGPVMRFIDKTIQPGVAYEYQVIRSAGDILDVGYWLTGVELPAQAQRGNVYLLVDESVADELEPRLARFAADLTGDGWQVFRKQVPRGNDLAPQDDLRNALASKQWLNTHYLHEPNGQHAVVLVGHVPLIKTGQAAQDMRELFRRMVFNILIDNNDDHEKNHVVQMDETGCYHLSPAFDVLPTGQSLGFQQMRVGQAGLAPRRDHCGCFSGMSSRA